jgi:hypothetical protein
MFLPFVVRTAVRNLSWKSPSEKKSLVFLLVFNFIDVQSLKSVKMSLKFESLSCSKNSNNVSAQFNASSGQLFFFERHV